MLQADLMNIYKKSSKSDCTSNFVVSSDTLYPTPSNFAALKL